MELSDGIAFIALVLAGFSLCHSIRQGKFARRPVKLEAYRITKEFLIYCSKYKTNYSFKQVSGTRDLWSEIEAFAWTLEKLGPTEIVELPQKSKEIQQKAKTLQRELERLTTATKKNQSQEEIEKFEDSVSELTDWFHQQSIELKSFFEPHV